MNFPSRLLLAAFVPLLLASCASVSVDRRSEKEASNAPKTIYVAPFATDDSDFRVDREGKELAAFKKSLQAMLQKGLVTDLGRRLLPAEEVKEGAEPAPQNAWVIRGRFTKIYQGSRLLRGTIGFGAGRTRYETRVSVYDLSKKDGAPILAFSTVGGSGAEPGAITAIATDPLTIVIEAAAGGAGGVAHGLTEDTARTARQITAALSDYLYRHGMIGEEKWITPKQTQEARSGPDR